MAVLMAYTIRENSIAFNRLYNAQEARFNVDDSGGGGAPPLLGQDWQQGGGSNQEGIFYAAPAKRQMMVNADSLLFDSERLEFALVTDMDHNSRDPKDFIWRSY